MTNVSEKREAALQPDDFVCFAMYSAGHAFSRVYKPLLKSLGLTYPQYIVMVSLWASDDQTVGELCEKLFLESNTLTPLLKRLEAMGCVSRNRDPADERQVRVCLTRSGAAMRQKARDMPSCVDGATGLSPDALRQLRRSVLAVRKSLLEAAAAAEE
ncbi:MarR family transcriptional regulator [Caballeronia sordidicola]|uniref:MarR family transcriptional regulator n=1 Tax=Caballeronia sordidicola TaxID=196367 RepID=A0A158H7M0_CABSO|nr:MarR family winged helix-turn-helix transcriptional regulator [Caballeronia sordidicola]SAL39969.1 MarR family transcriptional regulator [Caballeronia sordidicola]